MVLEENYKNIFFSDKNILNSLVKVFIYLLLLLMPVLANALTATQTGSNTITVSWGSVTTYTELYENSVLMESKATGGPYTYIASGRSPGTYVYSLMNCQVVPGQQPRCNPGGSQTVVLTSLVVATPNISPNGGSFSDSVAVSLSTSTSGATVRYTTDGSSVLSNSTVYSAPVIITSTSIVKAKAFMGGFDNSAEAIASFTLFVANPTFSPAGGAYNDSVIVSINSVSSGAMIHYTTDGSSATAASPLYSAPITLTSSATIHAKAFKTGSTVSAESIIDFTVIPTVAAPNIAPNGGTYNDSVSVSLSSGTSGATIRYTTDGSSVTTSSSIYSTPFTLVNSAIVKTKAFKAGSNDSAEASAAFTVIPTVATPSISPNGGSYVNSVGITLATATSGATLRYTTDGSSVTSGSPVYSGTFSLMNSAIVKVKAFKAGSNDSGETSASFTLAASPPVINPNGGVYTGSANVSISSASSGAIIRYTTDGSSVTSSSPLYSGTFSLTSSANVKAKAFRSGSNDSSETSASFTINVAPPIISPNSGSFNDSVSVTLGTATSGATIRYTTDGSSVTTSSVIYSTAIVLTASATVKAMAFKSGSSDSTESSASLTVIPRVAIPSISPNGGTYNDSVSVSLSSGTSGATIRYTTDGSSVTTSSSIYSTPFSLVNSATVKTKAFKAGSNDSAEASAAFTVIPTVATPSISPNGGSYANSVGITLATATSGATLRYTTDGSSVTSGSPVYSGTFSLMNSAIVKVKAFKAGSNDSGETSASFTLVASPPVISPNGGGYNNAISVLLSTTTNGATIRYTTDGSSVTSTSPIYGGGFILASSATVKAKTFKSGMTDSAQSAASFAFTVANLVISPASGFYNDSVSVSLNTATSGAIIRYTTDNSSVTLSSPVYSGVISLKSTATVKAKAFKAGSTDSPETSASFIINPPASTPIITPAGGTFNNSVYVNITGSSDSTIRYSIDGSSVTTNSTAYSTPFLFTKSGTLKVKAFKSGATDSPEVSASYALIAAAPSISPGAGSYTNLVNVSLNAATIGATIRYTLDGSAVTPTSVIYTKPFSLTNSATVKAKTFRAGITDSLESTSYFSVTPTPTVATPVINPNGGAFTDNVNVTLSTNTSGATIRYTNDGSSVTASSPIYSGEFKLPRSSIIKAKAILAGSIDSAEAMASFSGKVGSPIISPGGGSFVKQVIVTLGATSDGVTIRYTVDGSSVTSSSSIYSGPITLTSSKTIKAKAFKVGLADSSEVSTNFTSSTLSSSSSSSSSSSNSVFNFSTEAPSTFTYATSDPGVPVLGASQLVATTVGVLDVSNGAAQYRVKIDLPPAARELKPSLSLSYMSNGGEGLMGTGWNISGLSTISRCRANFSTEAIQSQKSNPRYTNGDRLCLDGQKLVLASISSPATDSNYWVTGTEYKTEIDNFSRIVAYGTDNGAHAYFKVWTKDGRIFTYGAEQSSQNSRIRAAGKPSGPVNTWALDKVEDGYGNSYTVNYARDTAIGEYYPTSISYAPDSIVAFTYKDRIDKNPWGYDSGNQYQRTKLLDKITTYINVTNPALPSSGAAVREYQIGYTLSVTTKNPLVRQIQDCGFNSDNSRVCAKPLTFDWQVGELGFESIGKQLTFCSGGPITASFFEDVDDDGFTDAIDSKKIVGWGTSTGCFTPSGFADDLTIKSFQIINTPAKKAALVIREISGSPVTEQLSIARFTRGSSVINYSPISTYAFGVTSLVVNDFNNDALPDFTINGEFWTQVNSSTPFVKSTTSGASTTSAPDNSYVEVSLFDYNDDGLKDLSYVFSHTIKMNQTTTVDNTFSISPNLVDHFDSPSQVSLPANPTGLAIVGESRQMPRAGTFRTLVDINGDGIRDYLFQRTTQFQPVPFEWQVALGTGDQRSAYSFAAPISTGISITADSQNNSTSQYSYAYDYNKDGIDDLLILCPDTNDITKRQWKVFLSSYRNGQANFEPTGINPFYQYSTELAAETVSTQLAQIFKGDVNNDGVMDVAFNYQGSQVVLLGKSAKPDLMSVITDGFGAATILEYSTLVSDDNKGKPLYSQDPIPPVFPIVPATRNMQVVKKLSTSNGKGGYNDRFFNYVGAKWNIQGRGFLGFAKVDSTDVVSGVITSTEYRQDFPFVGSVDTMTVKTTTGDMISSTKNAYAIHGVNTRFPYVDYTLKKNYQLTTTDTNNPLSVVKTQNFYDVCGNFTQQITDVGTSLTGFTVTGVLSHQLITYDINNYGTTNCADDFIYNRTQFVSKTSPTDDPRTLVTQFEPTNFNPNQWKEVYKTTEFQGTTQQIITTIGRASNGVEISNEVSTGDIDGGTTALRKTVSSDLYEGIFPQTLTKTLSAGDHVTKYGFDFRFGKINYIQLPNTQSTTTMYDVLGRQTDEYSADQSHRELVSFYCGNGTVICPSNAVFGVATRVTNPNMTGTLGEPLSITYYDMLQREIRTSTYSFAGKAVNTDKVYNADGTLLTISEPFVTVSGIGSAVAWTTFNSYDALGHVRGIVNADGGTQTVSYQRSGNYLKIIETTTVVGTGKNQIQTTQRFINPLGQVDSVIDTMNTPVVYTYNSMGNLESTKVNNDSNTLITLRYDSQGNKSHISDPNVGDIDFEYNGFKELRRQTWQKNTAYAKSVVFKYDQLGRKISRVDAPVSGIPVSYQWIWDTKQKGMLTSEAGNGQVITYSYDGLSRVNNLNTSIAGLSNRAFVYAYDNYSRPTTTTYPKGFKIKRIYHAAGISTQTQDITDINNPKVLWALGDEIDLRGNYNSELWGNGVVTKTLYDQNNGQIENIISGRLSNSNKVINLFGDIQSLSYDSDSISNILSRTSQRTNAAGAALENLKEVFIYDALNRLKTSTTSGLFTRFKDYAYDELGNLKSRSDTATVGGSNTDVGALTYDRINGAGVNAVTSAGGQNYQYDKYGNMRKRGTETIDYNVFNKPIKIVGAATTTIEYDAENTRFREKNGNLITYSIVGGQYEEVINGTTSIQKNYVDGVILNTQTLSGSSITANETAYLHPDNAGSVEAITNALGTLVTRMSFSDWGSRQLSDWRSGTPATNFPTPEGYTGHYQMDQSKLVHMGGRVYDPNLGRFLSADLLVSSPFNSQSYNRYSYVNNNPLSRTDPTGYREDYSRLFLRSLEDSSSVFQWSSAVNSSFLAWGGTLQDDGSVTGITFWMESVPVANYASLQGLSRNQVYSNFYECMGMCHGNDGVTTDFLPDKDQQLLALSFTEFSAVAVGGIACGASVICGAVIGTSIFEASQDPIDLVGLGGAHNVVRGLPKRHSHHMPAAAASSLSYGKGPAISMSIADHKLTASFGPSRDAKAYREIQRQLIEKGKFREAQLMDIKDVQSLFGEKYNASIKQMLAYTTSLGL